MCDLYFSMLPFKVNLTSFFVNYFLVAHRNYWKNFPKKSRMKFVSLSVWSVLIGKPTWNFPWETSSKFLQDTKNAFSKTTLQPKKLLNTFSVVQYRLLTIILKKYFCILLQIFMYNFSFVFLLLIKFSYDFLGFLFDQISRKSHLFESIFHLQFGFFLQNTQHFLSIFLGIDWCVECNLLWCLVEVLGSNPGNSTFVLVL